jgi:hypothetical protein
VPTAGQMVTLVNVVRGASICSSAYACGHLD